MKTKKQLWEVLVPTQTNEGRPIRARYHRVWDAKVIAIAGGATIMRPAMGRWVSPSGQLFQERMIPVRVACTREQIDAIVDATLDHYPDQEAVMAYLVSEEVVVRHRLPLPRGPEAQQEEPEEGPEGHHAGTYQRPSGGAIARVSQPGMDHELETEHKPAAGQVGDQP